MILSSEYDIYIESLIKLFKTYARPHLDYASVVYSPHHLYLIEAIERFQKNFT